MILYRSCTGNLCPLVLGVIFPRLFPIFPSLLFPVSQGQRIYSIEESGCTETFELKLLCSTVTAYPNLLWVWMLWFLAKPLEKQMLSYFASKHFHRTFFLPLLESDKYAKFVIRIYLFLNIIFSLP